MRLDALQHPYCAVTPHFFTSQIGLGLLVGIAGSLLLTKTLASQLYGVAPTDVLTYGLAVLLLGSCALLAVWIPARTAARTDPMNVLRQE